MVMNQNDWEPRYVISVAARIVGVQTYTLRYYERIGIISPYRSSGNIRLYSERDIAQLRRVKTLMDDLGVNLAGIEVSFIPGAGSSVSSQPVGCRAYPAGITPAGEGTSW